VNWGQVSTFDIQQKVLIPFLLFDISAVNRYEIRKGNGSEEGKGSCLD